MIMRPIPKKLLIHSGTIAEITKVDRWGNATVPDPVVLKYVRIEPTKTVIRDKQNNEVQLSLVLFYDCKNSLPKGVKFTKDTVITINGEEHIIKTVEKLYDGKRLHHYEIGLV